MVKPCETKANEHITDCQMQRLQITTYCNITQVVTDSDKSPAAINYVITKHLQFI